MNIFENAFVNAYAFCHDHNIRHASKNLYSLIDEANKSHQPIQITGKRSYVVLLSESDWRAIQESLHLQAIPGTVDSIKQASKQSTDLGTEELDWLVTLRSFFSRHAQRDAKKLAKSNLKESA